jgi:hypothetical protein
MINKDALAGGLTGTIISFSGVTIADVDHLMSIVCAIVGLLITIVTAIVIPLIKWHAKAKADGHIDADEIEEATKIVTDGIEQISSKVNTLTDKEGNNKEND